jgi:hypothetical protein
MERLRVDKAGMIPCCRLTPQQIQIDDICQPPNLTNSNLSQMKTQHPQLYSSAHHQGLLFWKGVSIFTVPHPVPHNLTTVPLVPCVAQHNLGRSVLIVYITRRQSRTPDGSPILVGNCHQYSTIH